MWSCKSILKNNSRTKVYINNTGKIVKEVLNQNRGSECISEILINKYLGSLLNYELYSDKSRLLFEPATRDLKGKIYLDCVSVAFDLIQGLEQLHVDGIIHGDIKPANILEYNDTIKYTDYGSSLFSTDQKIKVDSYTTYYRAPEVWKRSWDYKADIWALGCTLQELHTGSIVFPMKFDPWPCFETWNLPRNTEWNDLINEMLNPDPHFRLGTSELLQHSLFERLDVDHAIKTRGMIYSMGVDSIDTEEHMCIYSKLCGLPFNFKGSYKKLHLLEQKICSLELKKIYSRQVCV